MVSWSKRLVRRLVLVAAGMVMMASCTLSTADLALVQGNYHYARGDYQAAMVQYFKAMAAGGENQFLVQYNLGNVYYSLGEFEAAGRMWDLAARTTDSELLFAVHFNQGIAFYSQGRFQEAMDNYRLVLGLKPDSMDAKLNLEHAQQKIRSAERLINPIPSVKPGPASSASGNNPFDANRLLEFVTNKENQHWKAPSNPVGNSGGADW